MKFLLFGSPDIKTLGCSAIKVFILHLIALQMVSFGLGILLCEAKEEEAKLEKTMLLEQFMLNLSHVLIIVIEL